MGGRSPQQKKALSYARDRRNDYDEDDNTSRKSIRRNKRIRNRSDRHHEHQVLAAATGFGVVSELVERVEAKLLAKKPRWMTIGWRKVAGRPLGETVENRLRRRVRLGMDNPSTAEARIDRIRRRRRR